MRRPFLYILALLVAALACAAPDLASARFGLFRMAGGGGSSSSQAIASVNLSPTTFDCSSASGSVVGAITVTMSPSSPAFSGTLSLGTGASNFSLSSTSLPANLLTNGTSLCSTYTPQIIATQPGAIGSPFTYTPTVVGSTGSLITSVSLVNTSGSSVSTILSPFFGLQFKKGDIATWPTFKRHDTNAICPYSQGMRSSWSDGSIKHLSFVLRCPSTIAASSTLQVDIYNGGSQPAVSARTTTELSNALIKVVGVGVVNLLGTWTSTLSDGLGSPTGTWIDGDAGKGWVVDTDFKWSATGNTHSSTTLDNLSINTNQLAVGQAITGSGLQAGTTISSINSSSSVTLSLATTTSLTGTAVTVTHGQLKGRYYTFLTTDGSGGLGGIRFLPRAWQPLFDNDTPAKNERAFSSLDIQYGAGPTTVHFNWPYNASTFTYDGSSGVIVPSANYYSGQTSATQYGQVPVLVSNSGGSLPPPLTANTIYEVQQVTTSTDLSIVGVSVTGACTGTCTMTPVHTIYHFGNDWGYDANARYQYIQAGGSQAADATLRVTRDKTYWHSTKTLPPYQLTFSGGSVADNSSWPYVVNAWTAGPVNYFPDATGDDPHIGLFTSWQVSHFYNQSAGGDTLVRVIGFGAGMYGYSVRDKTHFAPPNLENPGMTYTGFGSSVYNTFRWGAGQQAGFTAPPQFAPGFGQDTGFSHDPEQPGYAYLWTGEPQFYDLMTEKADGTVSNQATDTHRNPNDPSNAYGIITSLPGQTREVGWGLRVIGLASGLAPDTSPDGIDYKHYFGDMTTGSCSWFAVNHSHTSSWAQTSGQQVFWLFTSGVPSFGRLTSVWQRGFVQVGAAYASALNEDTNCADEVRRAATWFGYQTAHFSDYDRLGYYEVCGSDNFNNQMDCTTAISADKQWGSFDGRTLSWVPGTTAAFTIGNVGCTPTDGNTFRFSSALGGPPPVPGGLTVETPYFEVNTSGSHAGLSTTLGGSAATITDTNSTSFENWVSACPSGSSSTALKAGDATPVGYAAEIRGVANFGLALVGDIAGAFAHVVTDTTNRIIANGTDNPWTDPRFTMQSSY